MIQQQIQASVEQMIEDCFMGIDKTKDISNLFILDKKIYYSCPLETENLCIYQSQERRLNDEGKLVYLCTNPNKK